MKTSLIVIISVIVVIIIVIAIWYRALAKKQELAYADLNEYAACVKINDAVGGVLSGDVVCEGLRNKIKSRYGLDDNQIEQFLLKTK